MRIGDFLYFAPGIKFSDLDLSGNKIASQFEARIQGYYLVPAYELALHQHAFASGVLLVSCIDSLAKLRYGDGVGTRFTKWVKNELVSFETDKFSTYFYDHFRNGLVHETRIKNGGEFSFEQGNTASPFYSSLRINPLGLHQEICDALLRYTQVLIENIPLRNEFIENLRNTFEKELAGNR